MIHIYKGACNLSTRELGQSIIRQMHAPDDVDVEVYIQNLAMFVSLSSLLLIICTDNNDHYTI